MKNKKTILTLVLLIAVAEIWCQSLKDGEVVGHSFPTLSVCDERIYSTLDSVLEREHRQPYYTDTTLSIYMSFFFCVDSNCNPIHNLFLIDVGFCETASVIKHGSANGYFNYLGYNVFVSAFKTPAYVFQSYVPIDNLSPSGNCNVVSPLKAFSQDFTMLKENDNKSDFFQGIWDKCADARIMLGSKYDFYHSLYIYHHNKFHPITYYYEE